MGKPAARLTDMHTCPMVTPGTPPIPHVGGPISGPCVPPVLIGFLPAATVGDMCVCVGPPDTIAMGSPTVFIGGKMAARMGDPTVHGGVIVVGCPTVLIGEMGMGGAGGVGSPGGAFFDAALFDLLLEYVSGLTEALSLLGDFVVDLIGNLPRARALSATARLLSTSPYFLKKTASVIDSVGPWLTAAGVGLKVIEKTRENWDALTEGTKNEQLAAGTKIAASGTLALSSALIGAKIGAMAGSIVPGAGTVIGAVAGAAVGVAVGYLIGEVSETYAEPIVEGWIDEAYGLPSQNASPGDGPSARGPP